MNKPREERYQCDSKTGRSQEPLHRLSMTEKSSITSSSSQSSSHCCWTPSSPLEIPVYFAHYSWFLSNFSPLFLSLSLQFSWNPKSLSLCVRVLGARMFLEFTHVQRVPWQTDNRWGGSTGCIMHRVHTSLNDSFCFLDLKELLTYLHKCCNFIFFSHVGVCKPRFTNFDKFLNH
jgi:hypothetical protein